jgi:hypothetical protein
VAGPLFKKHLIHTAVIRRTTQTQNDIGELVDSWVTSGTIDCRYVQQSHRIADEAQGYPMVMDHTLLCNTGEDVTEEDQVANIRFAVDGTVVDAGPFTIESMLGRSSTAAHHISLKLERVE